MTYLIEVNYADGHGWQPKRRLHDKTIHQAMALFHRYVTNNEGSWRLTCHG